MLVVERSPDTEQEGKVEQPQQGYTAKEEQPLGYDSDYASTYDYPTTEGTNGNLSMEAVCVFQCYPFFPCLNPPLCPELVLIHSVLQQSDTNYYDQSSMEYQSHGYEQEVMDASYYNQPPVFLRQPVSDLM